MDPTSPRVLLGGAFSARWAAKNYWVFFNPNLGPRLTIVDAQGKRVARLGGENGPGLDAGKFLAPHGLALDSRGDIYVGEVGVTTWKTSFPDTPRPKIVRCLQKLERVS
jgi:hypothetical protein